jgi:hypothetical protein
MPETSSMQASRLIPIAAACAIATAMTAAEGYSPVAPRALRAGEVAVTQPGVYAEAGKTYVLTQDITAPASAIYLGKDVTLDLNGHTLTYAGAAYQALPNGSFEDGLRGWDLGKAPNARVEDRRWLNPMAGAMACILPKGEELVSSFIELPVANRAYYAMVAVASDQMSVDVRVEDAQGQPVTCELKIGGGTRVTCPELDRAPKLGGGVVFALLFNRPAGRYRIRVRAVNRDCIIDDVDIRPALDTGIGVVGKIMPWAYYKCVLDGDDCAFFPLAREVDPQRTEAAPVVAGAGTVTIRNGVIRSGVTGIRTWGILATAGEVRTVVDNVKVVSSGTNAYAMRICGGKITNCRTELDWQWIIDRHRQGDYGVNVTGDGEPSTVANCEFIGGQGQLSIRGDGGDVSGNLFVNQQRVVNHYSVSAGGRMRIHGNRFFPEQGSGILIFRQSGVEVYDNEFRIHASPPVNEYSQEEYSVSAVRITDYNAKPGDSRGVCADNAIHHNRMEITGRTFPKAHAEYKPMAYGIFMSVGGGENRIYENDITVDQQDAPNDENHGAYAFFIGGSDHGGLYHHNRVTSNVTAVWIANYYGAAQKVVMHDNIFTAKGVKDGGTLVPIVLGWHKYPSRDIGLYSNRFVGMPFAVVIADKTSQYTSAYTVGWTLAVTAKPGSEVIVANAAGAEVARGRTDAQGLWSVHLPQYEAQGDGRKGEEQLIRRTDVSAYQVTAAGATRPITMDGDKNLEF